MEGDTLRQRKLAAQLALHGHAGGSWRIYLAQMKKAGHSDAEIARHIAERYALALDASTVAAWRRQASREGVERGCRGSGVGCRVGRFVPDTRHPIKDTQTEPPGQRSY
jgi:hypothetical protein